MPNYLGSVTVAVMENSQIGEARRVAVSLAHRSGLDPVARGNLAIVVTELSTNLLRHAGGGEIVLNRLSVPDGLEVLSLDKGPGIADWDRAVRDGFSTVGGTGTGLGAVTRLSPSLEVYSRPDAGTAILVRAWAAGASPDGSVRMRVGAVNLPKPGETECGDSFAFRSVGDRHVFMIADGLGHGPLAAESSREAVRVFREHNGDSSFDLMLFLDRAHGALRKTRGAAVALAEVHPAGGQVRYAGAGNIAGAVVEPTGRAQHMVSQNGTVGVEVRKLQEFQYTWAAERVLVMHSDGLGTSWSFERYPGLGGRDPALIAGVLYRDYRRGRDDVTVLVAKESN